MKKILILIILFGGVLRFTAVNWDSFGAFHPDERNISWAVTRIHFFKEMNPKFFAYGGLPIYLYRALAESAAYFTKDPSWIQDWGHIAVVGRYASATLSTVSIGLIYLVGAVYFSGNVGLLSAALLAFSPWAIREAHFATTETMLVFFLLLLLYFSHQVKKKTHNPCPWNYLGARHGGQNDEPLVWRYSDHCSFACPPFAFPQKTCVYFCAFRRCRRCLFPFLTVHTSMPLQ